MHLIGCSELYDCKGMLNAATEDHNDAYSKHMNEHSIYCFILVFFYTVPYKPICQCPTYMLSDTLKGL